MKRHLNRPLTKRQTALALVALLGLALLGWGGWHLWVKYSGRPLSLSQTRRVLWKHVAKHARVKKIAPPPGATETKLLGVGIPAPITVAGTNRPPPVRVTTRTSRGPLDLPETTLSEYFRTNQMLAANYNAMYRFIGEELKTADLLLTGTNATRELTALALAGEASIYARTNALDPWLGARIAEVYLWPSLATASTNRPAHHEAVMSLCELAFRDAGETNNMIRAYETIIARSTRTASVDMARFRLALIYIDFGRNTEALALLKSLKSLKSTKIDREIATLERLAAQKKPK